MGEVKGEKIRTESTRIQAQADKDLHRVEERLQDLDTEDIEYLIRETTMRLKAQKLKQAWERRCKRVSYVDLQQELGN